MDNMISVFDFKLICLSGILDQYYVSWCSGCKADREPAGMIFLEMQTQDLAFRNLLLLKHFKLKKKQTLVLHNQAL